MTVPTGQTSEQKKKEELEMLQARLDRQNERWSSTNWFRVYAVCTLIGSAALWISGELRLGIGAFLFALIIQLMKARDED